MSFIFHDQLNYGLSSKPAGNMQLSAKVSEFLKQEKLSDKTLIFPNLVHGKKVAVVDDYQGSIKLEACDALLTNRNNHLLALTVADCLPVYFYDTKNKVIGLAHAGWRGVIQEIVPNVINTMKRYYQSVNSDIFVHIGPHLQTCHFQVQTDVANLFPENVQTLQEKLIFINLAQMVKQQLRDSGLPEKNISTSPECTFCLQDKYFSWRRDKPDKLQTMLAHITLN